MKKCSYIILLFWFQISFGQQNLKGIWKGHLVQESGRRLFFDLHIKKIEADGTFKGTTYIQSFNNTTQWGKKGEDRTIQFEGIYKDSLISFRESFVIKEKWKSKTHTWHITDADLKLKTKNKNLILTGPWKTTGGEEPGVLYLTQHKENKNKEKFKKRKVKVIEKLKIKSNKVQLWVWDKGQEDGDRITVYVNDIVVLDDYEVKKKKTSLDIGLLEGKNSITVHANNLGTKPPNTAAISVIYGSKIKTIVLKSDLEKSQSIEIKYNH